MALAARRREIVKAIANTSAKLLMLKSLVKKYKESQTGGHDKTPYFLCTALEELESSLIALNNFLPGLQRNDPDNMIMECLVCNDEASSFLRLMQEQSCPELFATDTSDGTVSPDSVAVSVASSTIDIVIKNMAGKSITIQVVPDMSIRTIKKMIEISTLNVPCLTVEEQLLKFNGTHLDNDIELLAYGVKNGSQLRCENGVASGGRCVVS